MKIAVDFDGTCVDNQYPNLGPDVPGAKNVLLDLISKGHKIFLYTMRSGAHLEDAIKWFQDREIFLSGINSDPSQGAWTTSPKCYAGIYIDDAAFGAPLIEPEGFKRPCINWTVVREKLLMGILQ